jgi:plastocyanin
MGFTFALSACSSGEKVSAGGPTSQTTDVFTAGLAFSPTFATINVGDAVAFHISGVAHDVTFRAATGAPANIPVSQDVTVTRTFNTKGTFAYDCQTHPGMSGTITVQ